MASGNWRIAFLLELQVQQLLDIGFWVGVLVLCLLLGWGVYKLLVIVDRHAASAWKPEL